jgi:YesN/AraC family two-component response regulator
VRGFKNEEKRSQPYPFETEQALLASISEVNKPKAQRLLNELMGHIVFCSGGDFLKIKTRIYELLVMLSRVTVNAGVSSEYAFYLTHDFFVRSQEIQGVENLCFALTKVMNQFIECIFPFNDVKNVSVIQKAIRYVQRNYAKKVSVESVAQAVNLTPSYFSKIFKKEVGCTFNTYLNIIRIEKSMKLLLYDDFKLKLVNIAMAVGFDDQSYFTKVFKRMTGMSPHYFREKGGRMQMEAVNPHLRRLMLTEHTTYHGFVDPA